MRHLLVSATSLFVALVVALHFLRPDASPVAHGISRYAKGPQGWVATLAFASLTVACLCAAQLLRSKLWLIAAAGLGTVALTPLGLEPSAGPAYFAHQFGALVFFCAATSGARLISRTAGFTASMALMVFIANVVLRTPVLGLLQRVLFAVIAGSLVQLWRRKT